MKVKRTRNIGYNRKDRFRGLHGGGARVKRPGLPETYARELIRNTGDKFLVPAKEQK